MEACRVMVKGVKLFKKKTELRMRQTASVASFLDQENRLRAEGIGDRLEWRGCVLHNENSIMDDVQSTNDKNRMIIER